LPGAAGWTCGPATRPGTTWANGGCRITLSLPGGPVPPYSSFAYTLDLLIPFGAFGLREAYGADGAGQWLGYALIASGWILATAVIAGITSAVRRD